jgi:AraC-like DNA-binding protein
MLLERSIGNDTYQELIVRRHELPDDLARRMYSWVGDALRHHITRNFDIDSQTIDGAVDEAVWASLDEETGRVRADPAKGGAAKDVDPSATERAHRRATAYLRLLEEQGQTAFLSAVAQDTKLSERTLAQVFAPESPETAAIACTVLGMDVDKFIAVLQAFHDDAGWQRFTADGSLDKACDYFDRIDPLGAATVLRHWQETPPGENHA